MDKSLSLLPDKMRPRFDANEVTDMINKAFDLKKPNIEAIIKLPGLIMTPF